MKWTKPQQTESCLHISSPHTKETRSVVLDYNSYTSSNGIAKVTNQLPQKGEFALYTFKRLKTKNHIFKIQSQKEYYFQKPEQHIHVAFGEIAFF